VALFHLWPLFDWLLQFFGTFECFIRFMLQTKRYATQMLAARTDLQFWNPNPEGSKNARQ
jgi:hypothetical protein